MFVFRADRKTKWPPQPLIGWYIFDFSATTERNLPRLERKEELKVLDPVLGFFLADQKNKMVASNWLRHFQLLLWNHRMEFAALGNKHSTSSTKFVFFGKAKWLPHALIGSTYSTKVMVLGRSKENIMSARPLIGWGIFDCSPGIVEWSLMKLNRKQENVTSSTNLRFFGLIGKLRWPPWPLIGLKTFDCFSEAAERIFITWQEARTSTLFVFSGRSGNQYGCTYLW